jgi:hypothetical protein
MNSETSEKIATLHQKLNSERLVDGKWYRRNHSAYELVCYINNIVALYLSGNYENIPVFIDRAKGYLSREDAATLNNEYRDHVAQYLLIMEREFGSGRHDRI